VPNDVPDELYDLHTFCSEERILFYKYIRTYNNIFVFTCFGVKRDKSLWKQIMEFILFRMQGQVNHYINELLPVNDNPKYLQLYFYDTEHKIKN